MVKKIHYTKIDDFTEHKLFKMLSDIHDPTEQENMMNLIDAYMTGEVTVEWEAGQPKFIFGKNK
jgi:hypothetical protein